VNDGISVGRRFVGVDLHLHRSVIAGLDEVGKQLGWVRIDNDPKALVAECRKVGRGVPVAIEATYGWYWAVDALRAAGFEVHLAHSLGMKVPRSSRPRANSSASEPKNAASSRNRSSTPARSRRRVQPTSVVRVESTMVSGVGSSVIQPDARPNCDQPPWVEGYLGLPLDPDDSSGHRLLCASRRPLGNPGYVRSCVCRR
jgi:transposase